MICTVVGARPNFIKMAPVILELRRRGHEQVFVHTGQHYDEKMSAIFFDDLGMPRPDVYLGIGSGSHADQTARVMMAFEQTCLEHKPDLVAVGGDVNSTLACALTATKLHIPVAHIEAGLRSRDRSMPEEINRILTDHLSEILFVTEPSGRQHLLEEGIALTKIHFVGNTMIDTLRVHLDRALELQPWRKFQVEPGQYGIVTLHRPSNVDAAETRAQVAAALRTIAGSIPLVFPIHPRTLARGKEVWEAVPGLRLIEPLGYLEFLGLMARAQVVITDSGGIQEETTVLGVRCITVRPNTERPVTLTEGTNRLVAPETRAIVEAFHHPQQRAASIPYLWDGHAGERAVDVIEHWTASRG